MLYNRNHTSYKIQTHEGGPKLDITNSIFVGNIADSGGGIWMGYAHAAYPEKNFPLTVSIRNCVFTKNRATQSEKGGALHISGPGGTSDIKLAEFILYPSLINNIFWKNLNGAGFHNKTLEYHGINYLFEPSLGRTFDRKEVFADYWHSKVKEEMSVDSNTTIFYEPDLNIIQGWDIDNRAFDADPLFVNADDPIGPMEFGLQQTMV